MDGSRYSCSNEKSEDITMIGFHITVVLDSFFCVRVHGGEQCRKILPNTFGFDVSFCGLDKSQRFNSSELLRLALLFMQSVIVTSVIPGKINFYCHCQPQI